MRRSDAQGEGRVQLHDTPWSLVGDRHPSLRLSDGHLVIVFHNALPPSKDQGGFIVWVGTYNYIR